MLPPYIKHSVIRNDAFNINKMWENTPIPYLNSDKFRIKK